MCVIVMTLTSANFYKSMTAHTDHRISTAIPTVTVDFCPAYGEVVLDREHGDRHSELLVAFQRQVNSAHVEPAYIAKVRKKLDLDQREAADIFGGGVNAFSRYENGKTKPPLVWVKLLKVLDRHPDLRSEVRAPKNTALPRRSRLVPLPIAANSPSSALIVRVVRR